MKESAQNEEKKKFLPNNNVHLYGFVNDVRMNSTETGRTAIGLDVVTLEQWKKDGETQTRRTYHDVSMFTDDKAVIDKYAEIAKDVKANAENRGVEGYKPVTHTVSLDGILVNRQSRIGDKENEETVRTVAVLANPDKVVLDRKQQEEEVRNRADLKGNVASVSMHDGFAVISIANHFNPKDKKADKQETWLEVKVDAGRKLSKEAYQALEKGEIKKGDFIHVGGQLHNNNFDTDAGKAYKVQLDLTTLTVLKQKQDLKEEVKAETKKDTSEKAAPKAEKEVATKPVAPKQSGKDQSKKSGKKGAITMG